MRKRRPGKVPTTFDFPEELLERCRREAASREVPLNRLIFRAVKEYMDAVSVGDPTPAALKHGLPMKRMLGDTTAPAPPDDIVDRRRVPKVKVTEDRVKKAG